MNTLSYSNRFAPTSPQLSNGQARAPANTDTEGLFEIEVAASAIDRDRLLALRALLQRRHGETPVRLVVELLGVGRVIIGISRNFSVQPSQELRFQIESIFATASSDGMPRGGQDRREEP